MHDTTDAGHTVGACQMSKLLNTDHTTPSDLCVAGIPPSNGYFRDNRDFVNASTSRTLVDQSRPLRLVRVCFPPRNRHGVCSVGVDVLGS